MDRPLTFAIALTWTIAVVCHASAQVAVQTGGGGARAAYPYGGQSLAFVLHYPQIQKEIEIIDGQKAELQRIQAEMSAKTSEAYKKLTVPLDGDPQERQKKYLEIYQAIAQETDAKVNQVLLPHQKKRLGQIMLQMKLQQSGYGYGFAGTLGGEDVSKDLGITDAQKEELKKKEAEIRAGVQKKYQEFYKKLNEETREELLSVLTSAQRKKLEEMTGAKFDWQQWQPAQPAAKTEKKKD